MTRLIDAEALKSDFQDRLRKAKNWKENALNKGDDELVIRAEATIDFICEAIMTIDYAPTVKDLSLEIAQKSIELGRKVGQLEGKLERPQGNLISRSELKKCAIPCQIHNGALTDLCVPLYQIDNAPTVSPERPQGECEKCDYRKFTENFIDDVVDWMDRYGITSIEQLSEILKGGAE